MLLSQMLYKNIEIRSMPNAIAIAVGISPKNFTVKYVFFGDTSNRNFLKNSTETKFALNFSALQTITPVSLQFSSLRPVLPKAYFTLSLQKPVYSQKGEFLGSLQDATIENGILTNISTEQKHYNPIEIFSISDAIIIKKSAPFPLGQRIPAPNEYPFCTEKDTLVSKSILRRAIKNGKLIRLTLSLSPFSNS